MSLFSPTNSAPAGGAWAEPGCRTRNLYASLILRPNMTLARAAPWFVAGLAIVHCVVLAERDARPMQVAERRADKR